MIDRRRRWTFMFIIFAGIMMYLFIYLQVIDSGIQHKRLQDQKTVAKNKNNDLKLDYNDIMSNGNIERYATENLGLVRPSEKQFRYIKE